MRSRVAALAAVLVAAPWIAMAQTALPTGNAARDTTLTRDDVNDANNPLAPKAALQLQDYFQPVLNSMPGSGANQQLVRGVLPHEELGIKQVMRATLPVASLAYGPGQSVTGLGDTTIYDVPVLFIGKTKLGAGPLVIVPTSTSRALGAGKWQVGGQAIVSAPQDWGLSAGYVSYQQSFENSLRTISAQPLLFYNLPGGYYLRSSGLASFDLAAHTSVVPIGLGLGRVFQLPNGRVVNLFIEPQYSVVHSGAGVPTFQVFAGFNIQFPLTAPAGGRD
jgi:hypothetical protein